MSSPSSFFAPGKIVAGKYRIERELGQGGMGIVVAARHVALDERVAIKFLLGQDAKGSATRRFLREARAAAKVKSDHVCRVFDFGNLDSGEPYLVMEYLDGTDLAEKLSKDGPQRVHVVAGWIIEVCEALAAAHAAGIVHRDLKPANVFLAKRKDGSTTAKVLDFGISKLPTTSSWSTQPLAMLGTPLYMSPEQLESARDVDLRTDVWSLGAMIYELLSGRPPFEGDTLLQLAVQIREREPRPLAELNREVPVAVGKVVERCLAKRREDRYASVADLVADLEPFATGEAKAIAARIGKHVVRASDPDLALEEEGGEEPTFPHTADHLVPAPAASSSARVAGASRDNSTAARAPTVDSSPDLAAHDTPETLVGVQHSKGPAATAATGGSSRKMAVVGGILAVVAVAAVAVLRPSSAGGRGPADVEPRAAASTPPLDPPFVPEPGPSASPSASASAPAPSASIARPARAAAPTASPVPAAPTPTTSAGPTPAAPTPRAQPSTRPAQMDPAFSPSPAAPAPSTTGKGKRELDHDAL